MADMLKDESWVGEARAIEIAGLTSAVFRQLVKSRAFSRDPGSAYGEEQVLELVLLGEVRSHFAPAELTKLWRSSAGAEGLTKRARALGENERFDLVIEVATGVIEAAHDVRSLGKAVASKELTRQLAVVPMAARLRRARDSFRRFASDAPRPRQRRVGRPPLRPVDELAERRRAR